MFTGIVEEIGTIQGIKKGNKSSKLLIKANKVLDKTNLGDSICTNGVCLTVTNLDKNTFEADVMAETLRRSNLGDLSIGSNVNLERALSLQTRLGGHIVSGHIDGVGEVLSLVKEDNATWVSIKASNDILKYIVEKGSIAIDGIIVSGHIDGVGEVLSLVKEDNATWVSIKASNDILKYIVEKGSIAIDGISLTVAYVDDSIFKVSIIPHTKDETTLLTKKCGETVNLECDVIGKYVEKLLGFNNKNKEIKESKITEDFLKNNGFF